MAERKNNITDYVKETTETFQNLPFNPVDSLVLSQLSYAKLERVKDGLRELEPGIRDFFRGEFFRQVFDDDISDDQNLDLFAYAAGSPRFRGLPVKHIEAVMDPDSETQFAAMTFELDGDTDYVAFRGTDGNLFGWKEDFNMSFLKEVPAQTMAVDYLNRHYRSQNPSGGRRRLIIGGHSKGGNLAIYGGLRCDASIHPRIRQIFSHDGPGFQTDVLQTLTDIQARDGIHIMRLVPESSVIGMLLASGSDYETVDCEGMGIMQHYAFSWNVDLDAHDFIYTEGLSSAGEYNGRMIREWLSSASLEERQDFTDTLYALLTDNGIHTLTDLKNLTPRRIAALAASLGNVDDEKRKTFFRVLRSLAAASLHQLGPDQDQDQDQKELPL